MYFSMPSMRRSRHPLARIISLLLGAAVIGVLLLFGLMVSAVLLVGGGLLLAVRQWKLARGPKHAAPVDAGRRANVLEGEFVVIQQGRPVTH